MLEEREPDFPDQLLEKINEHTSGGFILFYTNQYGEPNYIPYTDNQTLLRGLISYIKDIVNGISLAQKEDVAMFFSEIIEDTDEDEDS
jgi:hypothetical protein